MMKSQYHPLAWDTEFFKYRVGRIEGKVEGKEEIQAIDELIFSNQGYLTYFPAGNRIEEKLLKESELEWILADRKLVYIKTIDPLLNMGSKIYPYSEVSGNIEHLYNLAIQSGIYSRYNTDEKIGKDRFKELYRLWMENSLNKKIALEVLIYIESGQPAGFVTLGNKDGRADIGLIAVDDMFRGKGIGKELMRGAEKWFSDHGYSTIQVVTQGANKPACALYEKMGYQIESESFFYHIWNPKIYNFRSDLAH